MRTIMLQCGLDPTLVLYLESASPEELWLERYGVVFQPLLPWHGCIHSIFKEICCAHCG